MLHSIAQQASFVYRYLSNGKSQCQRAINVRLRKATSASPEPLDWYVLCTPVLAVLLQGGQSGARRRRVPYSGLPPARRDVRWPTVVHFVNALPASSDRGSAALSYHKCQIFISTVHQHNGSASCRQPCQHTGPLPVQQAAHQHQYRPCCIACLTTARTWPSFH